MRSINKYADRSSAMPAFGIGPGNKTKRRSLEIHVNLASQVHPDYGPETTIIFMHGNLLLSAKQLWAYEKWARRIGDQLKKRIIHISDELSVSTLIVFKMSIDFSSSL
ncbi:MAG: hypothetical protein HYT98_04920 [Candidatus Sungbacteria bacterium]|nr:hypothetical protein [Candidatus Sungbacteria bacterium]